MILGDKLYKLRKEKNLSQELLALELQISKTALIKWESNKAKPSVDNLMKICDFYETDIYNLLEDVSNVNFSNAQFKGSNNFANSNNSNRNSNNCSFELINKILDNQLMISSLFEKQNFLFEQILEINKFTLK